MNKKEVKKAPALRFKGFTNDWEQRKLEKLSDVRDGTHTSPHFYTRGYPLITSKNLKNGSIIFNNINYISQKDFNKINKRSKVNKNDILMGMIGTVGNIAFITEEPNFAIKNVALIKDIGHIVPFYTYKYLQSLTINKQIKQSMDGGTQKFLALNKIRNLVISFPTIQEQEKISNLFSKVDSLISLQQRKLRLLKLLKKATQQNIFASTECLPKLKYRNLTEKWQLYRLKDVAKITMGQSPNSKNYTQNPIDHILVQGNADIRNGYVFPRIWTTEITKIANKGDIILCVRAPAGDVGRTKFNVVIGRGVAAIKGNDFIFQQLQFMKSSGYWKKYISGSTFESINSNDIKNAKIFCPSQLEQKNISSLLDDIDTSIQIQQKNILDFKYIKQFLLQNMFI